jgi:hypothetical protein
LKHDSCGLPTAVSKNDPQTILTFTEDPDDLSTALVIITRTTDGGAGDRVSLSGFTLNGGVNFHGIIADHVSHFLIHDNSMTGTFAAIYSRAASGAITGNLLLNEDTAGILSEGGTGLFPSNVNAAGNRIKYSAELGVAGVDYPADLPLNLGQTGLTAVPYQFDGDNPDLPNGLNLVLTANDISDNGNIDNGGVGVRLFVSPFVPNERAIRGAGSPTLSALITGNLLNNNQQYGLVVDGGDAPLGFAPYSGSVLVSLLANSIKGNGVQPALFTFYNFFDTVYHLFNTIDGPPYYEYLQQATYHISDLDRELNGFDYVNPVLDPATGGPLNDRLLVNGSGNVLGVKLSIQP